MAKKKSKNGILASRFYRIYFIVVGAALLMIVVGLIWLNGVVRDYEIAQPAHAAEEVARLFEEGDYARIYGLDTSAREISGGDEAFYVDSLKALAEGKTLAWREASSYTLAAPPISSFFWILAMSPSRSLVKPM